MRRPLCLLVAFLTLTASCACAQSYITNLYDYGSNAPEETSCWQQASDGNLYAQGLMFNMTTKAAPSSFPLPSCNFIQGSDTNFYSWNNNVISKVTLAGVATPLHTLSTSDGATVADIIQGNDGNFYGISDGGGTYNGGTLFTFTSAGGFTKLYDFTDGTNPGTLVQASDGNLYGSTSSTIFKSTLAGSLTTIAATGGFEVLLEGPSGLLYGNLGDAVYSVSLAGDVTEVVNGNDLYYGQGISGPCYMDSGGDVNCSTFCDYRENVFDTCLVFVSELGYGEADFDFDASNGLIDSGDETASYFPGGDGSYFGVDSWSGVINDGCGLPECVASDTFLYQAEVSTVGTINVAASYTTSSLNPGQAFTLTWSDSAWSDTAQYCFASGAWSGVQAPNGSRSMVAPATPGTYRYALTCGGTQTNAAVIAVGVPTVTLAANQSTFVVGTPLTLTAQVAGQTGVIPTGKVNFLANSVVVGSANLNASGVASITLQTAGVTAGVYTVAAQYAGSATYAAETSAATTVTVLASRYATTSHIVGVAPQVVNRGQSVAFTGYAAGPNDFLVSGNFTLSADGVVLGSGTETNAQVVLTISTAGAPLGTYPVVLSYLGNAEYAPSTSAPVDVIVVAPNDPSMTADANPATVTPPATVTLSANVGGVSGQPVPTGTVSFYYSTILLGTATLNGSGIATLSKASTGLGAGVYDITANYSGDNNYVPDSATVAVTVQ